MRRRALLMGGNQKPLIIQIDTRNLSTGSSDANTFTIPTTGMDYQYRVDWGDGTITNAHTGNASHTYSSGGVYEVKITGKFPRFYFNNTGDRLKLLRVISWGNLKYDHIQNNSFWGCVNLTGIAEDEKGWYNSITDGSNAFRDCKLPYLPSNMTLLNLTIGNHMFRSNFLTSLPSGMTFPNLTSGVAMFRENILNSLPSGMVLHNLTDGNTMFYGNLITSATSLDLRSLNSATNMFFGANNNINSTDYSNILIRIEQNNLNNDVEFHAGNSKYNSSAVTARAILTSSPRNWTITDGGLE